jgi:Cu(I)/Ag(I) efflux system membrane fusion protein
MKKFVLLFIVLFPLFVFESCKEKKEQPAATTVEQPIYTCSMHPQIKQHRPGTCPICGMDLVLFDKNNQAASLTLNKTQQSLANIQVAEIGSATFNDAIRLNGRLVVDPQQTTVISSRVAGRIEKLFVKETGVRVTKGQPLYEIYSEQLLTLQQELLVASAQATAFPNNNRFAKMAEGAKQKLLLYGQTPNDIDKLLQAKQTHPYILYTAPASGVVSTLDITQGQYVAEGGMIMQLENYAQLWVEADLYPSEASLIKPGENVQVIIPGFEQEPQQVKINFTQPALPAGTQLLQVRGAIENKGGRWQPGMQALVIAQRSSGKKDMVLPVDAVIRNGQTNHVWVAVSDGQFEPREVSLGAENADRVEITDGLKPGDKVVVSGAYLLHSEFILKKGSSPEMHHH